jgi:gliding motility-associated-like protein
LIGSYPEGKNKPSGLKYNLTFHRTCMNKIFTKTLLLFVFAVTFHSKVFAQHSPLLKANKVLAATPPDVPASNPTVCATSGADGTANINGSINTYFPPLGNATIAVGGTSVPLAAVPPADTHGNNFGTIPVKAGDLMLIVQTQDATINYTNTTSYGGPYGTLNQDGMGASGFTSLGNTGKYEYVIATSDVPLTGGILSFKGSGNNNGAVYNYVNADATSSRGRRTFQVIRIPQYANLHLTSNISPPPFNGKTGGIIAFEVSGNIDFNGFTVDVSGRGFRGGYSLIKNAVGNIPDLYVTYATDDRASGKGEGIAGTPRYMWDGFNEIDNIVEGLPGGSAGRGAPANAGGGGNDTNSGGGGGGNGNSGGVGGWGYEPIGGTNPSGGRPGSRTFINATPEITRIAMGGGGGGGHANDAFSGVKGGVGGGIVLVNARTISGNGTILANGADGAPGVYGLHPDGSGGGGGGGSIFLKISNASPTANITMHAIGGKGGNTENDSPVNNGVQPHGPGGGGSGGIIFYNIPSGVVHSDVSGGNPGKTENGNGITHNAGGGAPGSTIHFDVTALPPYLLGGGTICFPELTTTMSVIDPSIAKPVGGTAIYIIKITNKAASGNAGGVQADCALPAGFSFQSATATYSGSADGPAAITNQGTATRPLLGDFNIPADGVVTINLTVKIDCIISGQYNSSVQAIYLDPTRDYTNPTRKITAKINAFQGTNTTYQTISSGTVPGSNYNGETATAEDVIVVNNAIGNNVISQATPSPAFCSTGDPSNIIGTTPTGGSTYTYQWQKSADGVSFVDITGAIQKDYDPSVITSPTYYRRAVTNAACSAPDFSNIIAVEVQITPSNNIITAPGVASFCVTGDPSLITGSMPSGGNNTYNYQWQNSTDNVTFVDINGAIKKDYDPPVLTSTTYYKRVVTSGACIVPIASNSVSIIIIPSPIAPVPQLLSQDVCLGSTATLVINQPQTGIVYNWYDSPARTSLLHTGSTYVTAQLYNNTTFYCEAVSNNCSSTALASAQVNMISLPAVPQVVKNNIQVCAGSVTILSILSPQAGLTYNWYTSATGTVPVHSGVDFATTQITSNVTYYAEAVNSNGCNSATREAVNILINQPLQVMVQGTSICPGSSATLTAITDQNAEIGWYADAIGGAPLQLGTTQTFTTPVLNSAADYYVEAKSVDNCAPPVRTKVQVQMLHPLSTPAVSVDGTTPTSVSFKWTSITGAKGYQVSVDNGPFTDPSSGSTGVKHTVSGLNLLQKVSIIVRTVGNTDCELSGSSIAVIGTAASPLGNQIFVPNAFTPNGDGNNDIVYVHSENIKNLNFYVYDQWGELLFTSISQAQGWDGYYKGTQQPVGVYVYYVKAIMNDGQQLTKKGTITLLR